MECSWSFSKVHSTIHSSKHSFKTDRYSDGDLSCGNKIIRQEVMNGSGKDNKTDDIHGMSSPKKKLMNAKEQAAYFEREVRCYVNNSLLWI